MEHTCIFCRKTLHRFQRKSLWCGNSSEIVCRDCYEKYENLNNVERAYLALEHGKPMNQLELREFVERIDTVQEEKRAQQKDENEKRVSDKTCLRCGGRMLNYGPITLKLGEETYFMSDLNRLISGSLNVEILRCEDCGKAEFFIADDKDLKEAEHNFKNLT